MNMMRLSYRYLSIYLSIYLLLCLFTASDVYAVEKYTGKVYTDQHVTYYDVSGLTSHALRRQMDKKGPRTQTLGTRRYGSTQWHIRPDIKYLPTLYGCEVGNVEINISIEYIYPNWVNRADAHPQVIKRWDGFYRALMEYEEMHAQNGIEAANELATTLLRLYSNRTCDGLEYEVNSHIMRVLKEHLDYSSALDQRTGNGISQGVWLP